ncbi:MAG TPA: acetate--CoA ligase [Mariprofundaceae bacterium]|nr:acetate--CoA ligase [Mariprofundaceae bacterium]
MRKHIETTLDETRVFQPPQSDAAFSSLSDWQTQRDKFNQDFEGTWAGLAREHLTWQKPFHKVLNDDKPPFYKWFEDGNINLSENCLDRHVANGLGERTAIIWEGEPGDVRHISYTELLADVCKTANGLKTLGINKGDRVVLYMPMIPEAAVAMLACARIGATHSVVFGGFSAQALRDRIEDAGAKLVITADGGYRRGKVFNLKNSVDEAASTGCESLEHVLVVKRGNNDITWHENRDVDWATLCEQQGSTCEPATIEAEHPLFILYTSGSTGKPKGIVHSTGGYLLWAHLTMLYSFDFRPESDVFWCTADVGWITGHSYSVYGPLSNGGTTVMYEGTPTYPDAGRFWKICQDHEVSIFYTAPTAIRALNKAGDAFPNAYDLTKLRVLGTVGEPINPEAWMWYYEVIGSSRCPIVDTWWQTETGGHMLAPMPFATPIKPGSATLPLPGVFAEVVDEQGEAVEHGGGLLVMTKPWPSMLRGIWGDDARFVETYWQEFATKNYYLAGDSARKDDDGYFWIMGRIDDVLNVSGHRLGTMEIESALVSHEAVAEAAVVGRPDPIKGEGIFAFVILKVETTDALEQELRNHVAKEIGAIAKPDVIRFTDNLPKTRSGKIMRRLLRDIAADRDIISDISTLEDQSVIARLQGKPIS